MLNSYFAILVQSLNPVCPNACWIFLMNYFIDFNNVTIINKETYLSSLDFDKTIFHLIWIFLNSQRNWKDLDSPWNSGGLWTTIWWYSLSKVIRFSRAEQPTCRSWAVPPTTLRHTDWSAWCWPNEIMPIESAKNYMNVEKIHLVKKQTI